MNHYPHEPEIDRLEQEDNIVPAPSKPVPWWLWPILIALSPIGILIIIGGCLIALLITIPCELFGLKEPKWVEDLFSNIAT